MCEEALLETWRRRSKLAKKQNLNMQKRLQEEEVLTSSNSTWNPGSPRRRIPIESIAEKAWQITQSSDTKGKNLEQTMLSLAKENGCTKDKEDMAKKCGRKKKERS